MDSDLKENSHTHRNSLLTSLWKETVMQNLRQTCIEAGLHKHNAMAAIR